VRLGDGSACSGDTAGQFLNGCADLIVDVHAG
jgi:hypothetical protein